MNRILCSVVIMGLLLPSLLSCGGDSSSPSSQPPEPTGTGIALTSVSAEGMATNAAAALPGCSYTSASDVMTAPMPSMAIQAAINAALNQSNRLSASTRATSINETTPGSEECLAPGFYTETGTHDNGVDDLVLTFDNYCMGDQDANFTIDGVLQVVEVGEPSDSGPIPQNIQLSTGTGGLDITETEGEETFYHAIDLSDVVYTYGNGEDEPTFSQPDTITVDAVTVVDGRGGREYSLSDVDITTYSEDESNQVIKINSLNYTDPENGSVNIVSVDSLVIDNDGALQEGTIKVTGQDSNVVLMLTPSETVTNSFKVTLDGEELGTMDCSGFVAGVGADDL